METSKPFGPLSASEKTNLYETKSAGHFGSSGKAAGEGRYAEKQLEGRLFSTSIRKRTAIASSSTCCRSSRLFESEPDLTVEAYGDPQVLVMVAEKPVKPRIPVLILAWLLLFFGAGLAIMNFHTDVSMKEVHIRIVELITGKRTEHPLWFQIPYSLGIGLGMMLFFNHLFRKRFNEEPNPLEVELYMYQENVNAYVIADEMRKKSDYDQTKGNKHD